jgi:hypothetical protein
MRVMADDLSEMRTEIAELRKLLEASPAPKGGKDIWEKIGTLSTLFSTVILGAVGLFATQVYNQHQLAQQHQESLEKARVERAQVLDKFLHYVASSDPREREFGYAMFAYFDQAELALKLIALKKDQAGTAIVETLKQSSDPGVRSAALAALLTLQQEETVRKLLIKREGTSYDFIEDSNPNDLSYGLALWSIGNGTLFKLLDAYTQRPNAKYASQVRSLISTGAVVKTPELNSTLKVISADPVMQQLQDDLFRRDWIEPAVSAVGSLGLRLPLSIAAICDTAQSFGWNRTKNIIANATKKTGNSPDNGGDEKQWTVNFLDERADYYKSLPRFADFGKAWLARVEVFRQLAKNGDWMLTSAEAQAAPPQKPD